MRKIIFFFVGAFLIVSNAYAVSLGPARLYSFLNQPLHAEFELREMKENALSTLKVSLASKSAYQAAGIEPSQDLQNIQFTVSKNNEGRFFIKMRSKTPVRNPILPILIQVSWANGALDSTYNLLLDPAPKSLMMQNDSANFLNNSQKTYGPTKVADNLWQVAKKVRTNERVSIEQVALAIYKKNPDAFASHNMHALMANVMLKIPTAKEVEAFSSAKAFAEVHNLRHQNDSSKTIKKETAAATLEKIPKVEVPNTSPMLENQEEEMVVESFLKPESVATTTIDPSTAETIQPIELHASGTRESPSNMPFPNSASPGATPSQAVVNGLQQKLQLAEAQVQDLQKQKQILLMQLADVRQQNATLQSQLLKRETALVDAEVKLKNLNALEAKNKNIQSLLNQKEALLADAETRLAKIQAAMGIKQNILPKSEVLSFEKPISFTQWLQASKAFFKFKNNWLVISVTFVIFMFVTLYFQRRKRLIRFFST